MGLQAKIDAKIAAKIDAMIEKAIEKALGGDESPVVPASTGRVTSANASVQDLMDVCRRAVKIDRTSNAQRLSKAERKLARQVMKAVKSQFTIVSGSNDVWSKNGL